jgi:hypothetical protein
VGRTGFVLAAAAVFVACGAPSPGAAPPANLNAQCEVDVTGEGWFTTGCNPNTPEVGNGCCWTLTETGCGSDASCGCLQSKVCVDQPGGRYFNLGACSYDSIDGIFVVQCYAE